MKTSSTISEIEIREHLLDVLYGQWHALGVPFSVSPRPESAEVIDPEALLWCSLEFLPTEPRLLEGTVEWLRTQGHYLVAQRIVRLAGTEDPRSSIWQALPVRRGPFSLAKRHDKPEEPSYGLRSPDDVIAFSAHLKETLPLNWRRREARTGRPLTLTSTLLLRARDLLGSDVRHILLVYLLANPNGLKLRDVERFSGYSYRSLSEAATRWEAARLLSLDAGYCRLLDPGPWHALLRSHVRHAVIVDWLGVFDALVRLLRAIAKASRKDLATSAVIDSFRAKAEDALRSGVLGETRGRLPFLDDLRRVIGHRLAD